MKSYCAAALGIVALCGCATVKPPPARPDTLRAGGVIVRVNFAAGYVVTESSVLPSPNEEATVVRGNQAVGRIRFTGQVRPPYGVADLISGNALAGDRWRVVHEAAPLEQQP